MLIHDSTLIRHYGVDREWIIRDTQLLALLLRALHVDSPSMSEEERRDIQRHIKDLERHIANEQGEAVVESVRRRVEWENRKPDLPVGKLIALLRGAHALMGKELPNLDGAYNEEEEARLLFLSYREAPIEHHFLALCELWARLEKANMDMSIMQADSV